MSFILLPTGKLYKKREKWRLKNLPAGYVRKFYRNLADNVDLDLLGSEFYGRIANDAEILSADVQKYILASSNFSKGTQTGINHYVAKERINPILHNLLIIGDKKFFVVIYQFKVILENDHIKLFVIAFSIWGFWSLLL